MYTAQINSMQVKSNNNVGIIFFRCPDKVLAPKGIHPKYYKHLKKVLNKAIWVDTPWTGFWQISLYCVHQVKLKY